MDVAGSLRDEMSRAFSDSPSGIIVMDVKGVLMLKATVEAARMLSVKDRGIIITIDRPHQYLMQALKGQNVPVNQLVVLDVIARFSADISEESQVCSLTDGPFNIDRAPEALRTMSIVEQGCKIDINSCSFILVDNLGALLPYNSLSMVETFVKGLAALTRLGSQRRLVLMADGEKHQLLMEMLRNMTQQRCVINAGRPPGGEKR
jgi:hypothetical protein